MADVLFYLCTSFDPKSAGRAIETLWYIWSMRNKLKHDNVMIPPRAAISRITSLANEYYKYHVDNANHHFQCSDFRWKPRPLAPSSLILTHLGASLPSQEA
ncbi:hypothetical protein QQ045_003521 [Rhodiola kirilowii]